MKGFIVGGAFGFVLGAAVVFFSMRSTDPSAPIEASMAQSANAESANEPLSARNSTSSAQSQRSESQSAQRPIESAANASFPESRGAPALSNTPINVADAPAQSTSSSTESRRFESKTNTAANPIPMTDAHRAMLAKASNSELAQQHAALEQESVDNSWSYSMEQILNGYLAARAPQVGVEITQITCRSTACEIQAFDATGMGRALSGLLEGATRESWWEFSSMSARTSSHENRSIAIVLLGRAKKSDEQQNKLAQR